MNTALKSASAPIGSVTYILVAELVLTLHDVIFKTISGQYPVHEIVLIRSFVAIIPVFTAACWTGGLVSLKTGSPLGHIIRGLFYFTSYLCFYLALSALPLAETISLFFSSPIFITILSVLVLKEKVARSTWIAVFAGFAGVVILLKPGSGMVDPAAFLALLSAFFYGLGSIMTRRLGETESGLSLVFYMMIVYIFCSSILAVIMSNFSLSGDAHPSLEFFFRPWKLPVSWDILFLLGIGLLASLGIYCLSQAYRLEQPSKVAPFEYFAVILGVIFGYVFWKEVPGPQSIAGIALIVGSGLYIFREK